MTDRYYEPEGLALDIFKQRYALHDDETFSEACERVASHVAAAEKNGDVLEYREKFSEILKKNLFMPGGRIWYSSGRPKAQLLNCFVVSTSDTREGWGKTASDMIVICGTGGGLGINFSPIRPRGSEIGGHKGRATGAVSLMEILNSAGGVIKAGGGRRTALMFCLGLTHGDIEEFLDKKLNHDELTNANVSVWFDDDPEEFFEKVKNNEDLELKFGSSVVRKVSAKKVWDKIIDNALVSGEPGLLNGYLFNKMNNIVNKKKIISTNPCVTGDTLVAVADGRNAVPIKQLAEEGKDVPVYSIHPGTGKVEIKIGVNPRITGEKKEVWKLILDDGSIIRATPDHKFITKNLKEVELKDLKSGDSLIIHSKWKTNWKEIFKKSNSRSQDYWALSGTDKKLRFEHSIIAEFNSCKKIEKGYVVHHKNYKGLDNFPDNLQIMKKEDHDKLHAEHIKGNKNPYHKMSDEWKQRFATHSGKKNGMFGKENKWGNHSEETKEILRQKNIGKKHTEETKKKLSQLKKEQTKKKYKEAGISQYINKNCNNCLSEFTVAWQRREQMYCSSKCFLQFFNSRKDVSDNKKRLWQEKRDIKKEQWLKLYTDKRFELGRDLKKKEWEEYLKSKNLPWRFSRATFTSLSNLKEAANDYNHRVVSVEFDGYEDVYNITVKDNHNFGIVLPIRSKTKSKKDKQYHIFTRQCGEIGLTASDCCCLGAMVLPRFVKDNGQLDWSLLKSSIKLAHRFLDNVLTVNNYPLKEIHDTCTSIRRVGLGVMGLHDMLLLMGLKYTSAEGLEVVDKVMKFIKNAAYESSIELAIEKGPFPEFDADDFLKGGFAKTLKPSLRNAIREHGVRNCASLTIAPTGTTSLVCDVTSGIEPMFASAYERRYMKDDNIKKETVVHPLFVKFVEEGKDFSHFEGAYDLTLRDHFEMQRTCQRHVDNAVSKTINIAEGVSREELSDLYMEYFPELKGVTVYPEGSREDQPLTPLNIEDAFKITEQSSKCATTIDPCRGGSCDI